MVRIQGVGEPDMQYSSILPLFLVNLHLIFPPWFVFESELVLLYVQQLDTYRIIRIDFYKA